LGDKINYWLSCKKHHIKIYNIAVYSNQGGYEDRNQNIKLIEHLAHLSIYYPEISALS
jgi:hypothetical protein